MYDMFICKLPVKIFQKISRRETRRKSKITEMGLVTALKGNGHNPLPYVQRRRSRTVSVQSAGKGGHLCVSMYNARNSNHILIYKSHHMTDRPQEICIRGIRYSSSQ